MTPGKSCLQYCLAFLAVLVFLQSWSTPSVANQTSGRRLFQLYCASCHGPNGDGGRGPSLAVPVLYRAPTRKRLIEVIQSGIPGTEMPGSDIEEDQARLIAAWVSRLGKRPPERVFGNARLGNELYLKKGACAECHAIKGEGGVFGPDLTDIGLRRSAGFLRAALTDPDADLPEGFLQARAVTKRGDHIHGVRINEDSYSIQLRTISGQIYSLFKSELAQLHKDRGKSPMPGYGDVFSNREIEDVVAFLVSLRGEK